MTLFVIFLALVMLGVPMAFSFLSSALIYLLSFTTMNPNLMATTSFAGVDSFTLLAIPLFVFAGDIMREGGVSKKLVDFSKSFFKESISSFGTITVVACAFFGAVSGSAIATVAAIGGIMIPEMVNNRYKAPYAASLSSASGYLGMLIPPSVPIVLYCVSSGDSIGELFMAGIVPGVLATVAFVVLNRFICHKYLVPVEEFTSDGPTSTTPTSRLKAIIDVIPGLLMPVIILGGIYSGYFSPTEAAAIAIIYGLLVSLFIYKQIKITDIPRIARESAMTAGRILIIIAFVTFFGRILTFEQIPEDITNLILGVSENSTVILMLIIAILLLAGMLMDMSVSILLLVPIMQPIAVEIGYDPTHFAMIFIFCLAIGLITPPMALNMFAGSQISGVPISQMIRPIWWFVAASFIVLLLVIFVEPVSTFLPTLMGF